MNKTDALIGLVVIVIAAALAVSQWMPKEETAHAYVSVQIDGKEVEQIPMTKDNYHKEYVYHAHGGTNKLVIDEKGCTMVESDCPDGICLRMAPIKSPGEMIVCLPHRIVAEVKDEKTPDMDVLLK
ncbi:MAG: NusG domain II-containing protein [Peptoniphilus sp.]|nr:NusG domain II-containing protein [Peptoniphilus sp.]MDD7363675.1 NusG domain II-containing protein [Bacillota bacterium]MDY6044060.1 NusG domain II-containing protein [Peptoniphilus sp.]